MRRIIGCTEVQGCWPLDLMTKLEGSPYRADYSGKGPFIIDGSSLGAPHILHFQPSIKCAEIQALLLLWTFANSHVNKEVVDTLENKIARRFWSDPLPHKSIRFCYVFCHDIS